MGGSAGSVGGVSAGGAATAADGTAPNGGEPRFDQLLTELQAVVESLENSDMALEQSLQAFERGVTLARMGQQILDAAERKVELLLRDGSTEPLGGAER